MKRLRDFFSSPERTAWVIASASLLVFVLCAAWIFSGRKPVHAPQSHPDAELMRERMLLQARVNLCNFEKGNAQKSARTAVCDPVEEKRVDEYRRRIAEIDRSLGASL